jgi:hypothetical protein
MHRRSFLAWVAALPVLKWLPWRKESVLLEEDLPEYIRHTLGVDKVDSLVSREYSDEAKAYFASVYEDGTLTFRREIPQAECEILPPTTARTSHA